MFIALASSCEQVPFEGRGASNPQRNSVEKAPIRNHAAHKTAHWPHGANWTQKLLSRAAFLAKPKMMSAS